MTGFFLFLYVSSFHAFPVFSVFPSTSLLLAIPRAKVFACTTNLRPARWRSSSCDEICHFDSDVFCLFDLGSSREGVGRVAETRWPIFFWKFFSRFQDNPGSPSGQPAWGGGQSLFKQVSPQQPEWLSLRIRLW